MASFTLQLLVTLHISDIYFGNINKYSLHDRYGAICDKLLNTGLSIAQTLGVDEKQFRLAIDEVVGNSRIYDGEYDKYSALYPSEESLELEKGLKRWWKPRS